MYNSKAENFKKIMVYSSDFPALALTNYEICYFDKIYNIKTRSHTWATYLQQNIKTNTNI